MTLLYRAEVTCRWRCAQARSMLKTEWSSQSGMQRLPVAQIYFFRWIQIIHANMHPPAGNG
jgi:hypothetical protein